VDLKSRLALSQAELLLERQRMHEVRVLREVNAAETSTTRDQVARVQASLQRPAALFEN
jgi:hypothetical protein